MPPVAAPSRSFRFTLRGMMILVLGSACGCALQRLQHAHWNDGILAALSVWAVFGLAYQIRDLWQEFHCRRDLLPEERHGWRFAAGWRYAVITLLSGYFALQILESGGYVEADNETNAAWFAPGAALRTALLYLLLMFLVWSTPRMRRHPPKPTVVGSLLRAMLAIGGATLGLLLWWQMQEIIFLVHLACDGISSAQSLRFRPAYTNIKLADRYHPFIVQSAIAVVVTLLTLAAIRTLAVHWTRPMRRACLIMVVVAGLAASLGQIAWLAAVGFPRVSPWLARGFEWGPWHRWPTAGLTVAAIVAPIAARLARVACAQDRESRLVWRREVGRYYHEWRVWDLLLAVVALLGIAEELVALSQLIWNLPTLEESLSRPLNIMYMAVALLAVRAAFMGLTGPVLNAMPQVTGLSPARFWFFFWVLSITLTCLVPALAAFTFSLWLTPWYRLPGL